MINSMTTRGERIRERQIIRRIGIDNGRILDISPVAWLHLAQLAGCVLVVVFVRGNQPVHALIIAVLIHTMQSLVLEVKR